MALTILRPLARRHDPMSSREPLSILKETFGYPAFRGRQADVISHVVAGGSCLVLMPTGGGKSLCFQIPALARPGLGLVVSPLIALMQDQVAALKQAGVKAEFYNSTLDAKQKSAIRAAATGGELELLYVAPETLNTDFFHGFVGQLKLSLIAVDEAHCVSQWGHDFRPDYLHVAMLREIHPDVPLVALTATADPLTRKEILLRLGLQEQPVFASSFDRPNIKYEIALKDDAKRQLLGIVRGRHADEAGIVYCLSRKKVEETAEWLVAQGVKALPYHAGLDAKVRSRNQARFLREDGVVMVATIAFGMGIDKPDVRFVVHLDLPKSVESYYQETGRAGRDGLPSSAWMIYSLGDVVSLRKMIDQGEGSDDFKRLQQQKLGSLLGLCESVQCRRQGLLAYFDELHPGACANCDNCLDAPKTWDGTEAARKALSAVARTGERFGVGHAIDVLLGKSNERIARLRHDELTVWGVGKELPESRWSSVFRQLAAGGWVDVDAEAFGALKLNARSWALLKGEATVLFREDATPAKTEGRGGKLAKSKATFVAQLDGVEAEAFESLRALRRRLAEEQNLPPYVVFHDSTLREMVARKPASLAELGRLPGLGQAKLERYGAEFLSEICRLFGLQVRPEPAGSETGFIGGAEGDKADTATKTLRLFLKGFDPDAIAAERGLTVSSIWEHLSQAVESGKLSPDQVLQLSASERDELLAALAESQGKLTPVFERFSGKYPYEALKIVRASAGWG
jgi:ATP-dependent DNA helicase RecQ